jgi:toxin YoeB
MPRLTWTAEAWEDYLYWQKTDKAMLKRLNALIRDALRAPSEGLGKPEPLRFDLTGYWSRRMDQEHRLVYTYDAKADALIIVQCRYHY